MKTGTCIKGDETYNFDFYTSLSAYDKLVFVDSVIDTLVDDNRYNSIIRDIIFDFTIVEVFTNIDTTFINIKDEDGNIINPIIPIEKFLNETNVVDVVKANMEDGLLEELNHAVDLSLEYRTGVHPNYLNEALANLVDTIEEKVKEFDLDSAMGLVSKLGNMEEEFTVENIIKAYTSTDMFKNNMKEIEESKKQKTELAKEVDKKLKKHNK